MPTSGNSLPFSRITMDCHRAVRVSVLLVLTSAAAVASAQPIAFSRADSPTFAGARGLATGDFDRNGWTDIAHANFGRNTVTVLLNQGGSPPTFLLAHDIAVGAGPFDLTTADFDRDGILDLAVTNADAHTISVLRGRAAGGFTRTDLAVPRGPRGIAAGDVNDDGRVDLIVTGWDSNAVQVLFGNGAGGFSTGPGVTGHAARPQGVAAADFNRDGHLDVVVAYESAGGLAVLSGNGGSALTAQSIPGITNLNVVAVGDFNRDGRMDVAAASTSGNRVGLYLGTASGLRFNASYPTGASPRDVIARDINHDGALDVITANRTANTVSVLLGSTTVTGTLQSAETFTAGAGSRVVAAEDFDHDGRIDLVTGNQNASSVSFLWNDTVFDTAAFSFSRRSFGTPSNETGGSPAIPADFNEDGKLDVLVKPNFELGPVFHVLITGGPVVVLEQPQFHGTAVTGDFNDDGHVDVLTMPQFGQTARILSYLGDGRGDFTRGPETTFDIDMRDVAVGDLNRDGTEDIAMITFDRSVESYVVQVLIGQGDGSFRLGSRVIAADRFSFTTAPRIADVNRDGRPDIALFIVGDLTVFHGDGIGNFQPGSRSPLSNFHLQQLVLKDVNHDGWLDAIVGEQGRVRVSFGSAGGFAAPTLIEVEGFSNWSVLAVEDIDLDGHQDLVAGAGFILRGLGNGAFRSQESFDYDGSAVHVVDFTRDGLPDIVVPTTNGAYDVIVNRRNSVNGTPTVAAGPDRTFEYADQFADEGPEIIAVGTDPDLHKLAYQWYDEAGNPITETAFDQFLQIARLTHGTHTFTVTVQDGRGGSASDSVKVTIVPTKEIVLWSASGFHHGTFSEVSDPTAAGAERGYDRNLGRAKVNVPSANPANFIDFGFVADPTQTYKLWIRLRADNNLWSNDSVWVQFTGSTDAAGNAVFRAGTSSGLAVNLEECVNCGVSGWGWEDDGWGAVNRNGVTLRFLQGGFQRIIIQTREDGVSIDQIVLSSEKYLTNRPGAAKNDNTILQFTFWQEEG
jgi:hypothetical protein